MIKKEQILATVNQLPDEVPLEDLIEKLIAIQKIDQGLDDIREGRTYSNEEAKKKISKWLK
jgi:predicted transcriptional regulator